MRTLYITGWCVNRRGKDIRGIRARIGRQKFFGNYGIQRKDVAAALGPIAVERSGFAIAVPLPVGKSQVVTEVQEADGVWRVIAIRDAFGALTKTRRLQSIRSILFQTPERTHGSNSGSIVRRSGRRRPGIFA